MARFPARTIRRRHLRLPVAAALLALACPLLAAPAAVARSDAAITAARLVNEARSDRGLRRLEVRDHLNHVAYRQAERMADRGVLFHNPDLADEVRGDWTWVGENVGYGPDVATVHAAFMASRPHRVNVLDLDYDELGTAAVRRGSRVWVVHVFRGW
jgi:uncharacterized protein YkwD